MVWITHLWFDDRILVISTPVTGAMAGMTLSRLHSTTAVHLRWFYPMIWGGRETRQR